MWYHYTIIIWNKPDDVTERNESLFLDRPQTVSFGSFQCALLLFLTKGLICNWDNEGNKPWDHQGRVRPWHLSMPTFSLPSLSAMPTWWQWTPLIDIYWHSVYTHHILLSNLGICPVFCLSFIRVSVMIPRCTWWCMCAKSPCHSRLVYAILAEQLSISIWIHTPSSGRIRLALKSVMGHAQQTDTIMHIPW